MSESINVLEIIVKWALPFILSAIIGGLVAYGKSLRKQVKALGDGVEALLRGEIIRANDKYIDKGFCPIYAKESLRRCYDAYHALGGNDVATKLYGDVMALPEHPQEGAK